ncbi:MAG: hypothetical protein FWG18_01295 [Alphaproteobacteria bacterium]|nr:hypothetical protein [Alphaproteobacteria bacterium]
MINTTFANKDFDDVSLAIAKKKWIILPWNAKFTTAAAIILLRLADESLSYKSAMRYTEPLAKIEGYGAPNLMLQEIRCRIASHGDNAMLDKLDAFIKSKNSEFRFYKTNNCAKCFLRDCGDKIYA